MNRREAIEKIGLTAGLGLVAGMTERSSLSAAQRASAGTKPAFPKGAIIRLVLKDERPENLATGALTWHEHPLTFRHVSPPKATMTDEEQMNLMVNEFKAAQADGISCIFDASHHRRPAKEVQYARELARRSGVPFGICGAHEPSWEKEWWSTAEAKGEQRAVEELADRMTGDSIEQRWAALGEIGTQLPTTTFDRWYMKAVARVSQRTNLRIYTHVPIQGCPSCAMEQLDLYESEGVDPRHLCIGHLSDTQPSQDPGWATLKTIAKRGAWIGLDSVAVPHNLPQLIKAETTSTMKLQMVQALLDAGYEDNILFTSDTHSEEELKANYGGGYSTLMTLWVPKLRYAGLKEPLIKKLLIDNPLRFFAFVPKT